MFSALQSYNATTLPDAARPLLGADEHVGACSLHLIILAERTVLDILLLWLRSILPFHYPGWHLDPAHSLAAKIEFAWR